MKTYLNLGCGERLHPEWTNIDMAGRAPGVLVYDLVTGIPWESGGADVVYHSALLEHIRRSDVPHFLRETLRVLKFGGITRIGVPDWEKICRTYLRTLEATLNGGKKEENEYDWMTLEMLDQLVREESGGAMLEFLRSGPTTDFVFDRIGNEGRDLVKQIRRPVDVNRSAGRKSVSRFWTVMKQRLRNRLLTLLEGADAARALTIGRFRLSGEVHQWMYDRFSLARELVAAGFRNPQICSAFESSIPNWQQFYLDIQSDGTVNKPDLFFMEATKPT